MTIFRRLLLGLCAVGVLAGLALVGIGLGAARGDPSPVSDPLLVVAAQGPALVAGSAEVDALEVSVAEYAACVRAGACSLTVSAVEVRGDLGSWRQESSGCVGGRPDQANAPMNCVDWASADAYCTWAGKRLPTREEWWEAIGNKHPKELDVLHRLREERRWIAAEWTSTKRSAPGRGPWEGVRHAGAWRLAPGTEQHGEAHDRWFATPTRSPIIGFRCAR